MRYSDEELHARAITFVGEWRERGESELSETQIFYARFFEIFGVRVEEVAVFEAPVRRIAREKFGKGYADLLWKGVLLVEQKRRSQSLDEALEQAMSYCLPLDPDTKPRYILLCNFQEFRLYDLQTKARPSIFSLEELPEHIHLFRFIAGEEEVERKLAPVNTKATKLLGALYKNLKAFLKKEGQDAEITDASVSHFLVRILFCLFADNTNIFRMGLKSTFNTKGMFWRYLHKHAEEGGAEGLNSHIERLFHVLDTPTTKDGAKWRARNLTKELREFPYINGNLFEPVEGANDIPRFDQKMLDALLLACEFDWSKVSPAIFGSLFQNVMNEDQRRALGGHYTTEENILKVIGPLFLDDLKAEFEEIRVRKDTGRGKALEDFRLRLGEMKFLDPACGCGNFLVVTYHELRLLEIAVLHELHPDGKIQALSATDYSVLHTRQFHGIEVELFPSRIADTALWMMDHLMNLELGRTFGVSHLRIPLEKGSKIRRWDALETDWNDLLPAKECDFVLGNPPFVGSNQQSGKQRGQVQGLANLGRIKGTLDYVAAWFLKAGDYIHAGKGRIGLVATNSITQGEQVAQLWPLLYDPERRDLEISFAHRTFVWGSDAENKAHVHVVIIGLAKSADAPKTKLLFSYPRQRGDGERSEHRVLTPYLTDGSTLDDPHLVVRDAARPLNGFPRLTIGSIPIDGGNYIFTEEERRLFLEEEPGAERFMHPFIGAKEFIQGGNRWILALHKATPEELRALPKVCERMRLVREFRGNSRRAATLAKKDTPQRYDQDVIPEAPFLVVPEVSSERREYLPVGWEHPPTIPSNLVRIIQDADNPLFALLSSSMNMAWLRHVGGRLKSDSRYSIGVVYNTFPPPPEWAKKKARLEKAAAAVLAARAKNPNASLADLYDPDTMPSDLHAAHRALDRAVDRMYRPEGFETERARAEYLLDRYEKMTCNSRPLPNGED